MTELSATSAQAYITGLTSDVGGAAAVVITATIAVGVGIWLVFKFLGWLKGAV